MTDPRERDDEMVERLTNELADWYASTPQRPDKFAQMHFTLTRITAQDLARLAKEHGLAVVPEKPTDGILWAMNETWTHQPNVLSDKCLPQIYRAMIAAGRVKGDEEG